MVKLQAVTAIRGREIVRKANRPGERDRTKGFDIAAGALFEIADEEEAKRLVALGAAREAPAEFKSQFDASAEAPAS